MGTRKQQHRTRQQPTPAQRKDTQVHTYLDTTHARTQSARTRRIHTGKEYSLEEEQLTRDEQRSSSRWQWVDSLSALSLSACAS